MSEPIILSFPIYVTGPMGPGIFCLSSMMTLPFSRNSVLMQLLQGYILEPVCLWLPVLYTIWKLQLVQNFNPHYLKVIVHVVCAVTTNIKEISLSHISHLRRRKCRMDTFKQLYVFLHLKHSSRSNRFTFPIIMNNWLLNDSRSVPTEKFILNVKK